MFGDYLSAATADFSDSTLTLTPHNTMGYAVNQHQDVIPFEDATETRLDLDDAPSFFTDVTWSNLTATNCGIALNYMMASGRGNGVTRTFEWQHPTDGYSYVVRCAKLPAYTQKHPDLWDIRATFKMIGTCTGSSMDTATSTSAPGNFFYAIAPDNNETLSIAINDAITYVPIKKQFIWIFDDGTEERIDAGSGYLFHVGIKWNDLLSSDYETVMDFYHSASKGNGITETFLWGHPNDGYTYTVRFREKPASTQYANRLYNINATLVIVGTHSP